MVKVFIGKRQLGVGLEVVLDTSVWLIGVNWHSFMPGIFTIFIHVFCIHIAYGWKLK